MMYISNQDNSLDLRPFVLTDKQKNRKSFENRYLDGCRLGGFPTDTSSRTQCL